MPLKLLAAFFVSSWIAADLVAGSPQTKSPPMIVVEASYPGVNAMLLRDTVAATIEPVVKGVENSLHMASRCGNDGKYTLVVTFKPGTDLAEAHVNVQNRVAVVLPRLPPLVRNEGIAIRKQGPVRMLVCLTSPQGRHDSVYLSNYANLQIKDELIRIAGVGQVAMFGQHDYSMRVWLDPVKLAARKVSAADVLAALREQNMQVAPGQIGKPPTTVTQFQLPIQTLGRLSDPDAFADIIVKGSKTPGKEPIVRLKDVARTELGAASADNWVSLNGSPAVVLGVYPLGATTPKNMSRAVADKIAAFRARLPEGLRLEVAFDFTSNLEAASSPKTAEYLLLDLHLPPGAGMERMQKTMVICEKLLRNTPGVQDVLALSETPFDLIVRDQPCFLVRLTPADRRKISRQDIRRSIRTGLEQVPNAVLTLRDLSRPGSFPSCGYPIDLAVSWPADVGAEEGRELAQKFAERLQKNKKLTDVWANQESTPRPYLRLEIDNAKAMALGVAQEEIGQTLQILLGSTYVNDLSEFGRFVLFNRTWQLNVKAGDKPGKLADDLKLVKVRSKEGKMVPLAALASVKTANGPEVIHSLDLRPMVSITANPAPDVSLAEARKLCETLFAEVRQELRLPAAYRLTWLHHVPAAK